MNDHDLNEVERQAHRDLQAVAMAMVEAAGNNPKSGEYDRLEGRQAGLRILLNTVAFQRAWRALQRAEERRA